jgi:hypothetical protein
MSFHHKSVGFPSENHSQQTVIQKLSRVVHLYAPTDHPGNERGMKSEFRRSRKEYFP